MSNQALTLAVVVIMAVVAVTVSILSSRIAVLERECVRVAVDPTVIA